MNDHDNYQSPLASRYASREMRGLFSARHRALQWRRLWIALAEAEQELGLAISDEQLDELRRTADQIDFDAVAEHERRLRHDVMAHVHAWGDVAPSGRAILHLGATSCYVTDNGDLVILRDALELVRRQVVSVVRSLADFAKAHRAVPILGLTHYQPAQATTVGKRACLWIQDLLGDLEDIDHALGHLRFRGVKGTTGTQASFMELFGGDHAKVRALDERVTEKLGFERRFAVTGQTYPRKLDFRVCQVLSSIAQSAHKFASDLRLSAGRREMEEPFEQGQIGSSAMPWKRNPMRSERICALARFVMANLDNLAQTAAQQWFERTLDDSANRRLALPEMFLATDAILALYQNVAQGLVVHEAVVDARLREELPFLASEALMMEAVAAGGDRQDVHEALRLHARAASEAIHRGEPNPLVGRLRADPSFASVAGRIDELLDPKRFVGRAPEQVDEFLAEEVEPVLARFASIETVAAEIHV
ncbi:adenylosuccinate lyase [Engelhardtia mirabilis]|uniref:Adenylosuccinate lyase n=1 Tax=Engelhardtia mirabilis TaxID=2528011 RepID=A0A518BH60_9BACT|nr:Adenylosuccinate lyase [Planctomycetes bacterium Pla133]QDV00631.1 Adenylosuccinate lyase [Planctomycetes bacterium Pla86]